jgi:ribosomal protein L17
MSNTSAQKKAKDLFKMKDHLITLSGDNYYNKEKELIKALNEFLNDKDLLKSLTKMQLFDFIDLCSTHRPSALHSILLCLSKNSRYY